MTSEHLPFLAKFRNAKARYQYVYTEQAINYTGSGKLFELSPGLIQAEPPPIWAAYLSADSSSEKKEEGPWDKLGKWAQTGVSHMLPSGALAIQWMWIYK
ncbi:MAG: hypothetical protein ACTS8S_00985 [Giesbergeria sp.]